jgi:hypothetical protein
MVNYRGCAFYDLPQVSPVAIRLPQVSPVAIHIQPLSGLRVL